MDPDMDRRTSTSEYHYEAADGVRGVLVGMNAEEEVLVVDCGRSGALLVERLTVPEGGRLARLPYGAALRALTEEAEAIARDYTEQASAEAAPQMPAAAAVDLRGERVGFGDLEERVEARERFRRRGRRNVGRRGRAADSRRVEQESGGQLALG